MTYSLFELAKEKADELIVDDPDTNEVTSVGFQSIWFYIRHVLY